MKRLQVRIEDIPMDQHCTFHPVNCLCLACRLEQHFMRHAVDDFRILIAQILPAQFFYGLKDLVSLGEIAVFPGVFIKHGICPFFMY